jgi:hypothetical protein
MASGVTHTPSQDPELSCSRHSRHDGTEVLPTFLTSLWRSLYFSPMWRYHWSYPIQSLTFLFFSSSPRDFTHHFQTHAYMAYEILALMQ